MCARRLEAIGGSRRWRASRQEMDMGLSSHSNLNPLDSSGDDSRNGRYSKSLQQRELATGCTVPTRQIFDPRVFLR
jgi:hypothetical protein